MTSSSVYQYVDVKQWELILWTGFVEFPEVDKASYLTILLFHRDKVFQLGWVLYGLDETNFKELLDLLLDLLQLWPEMLRRLLERLSPLLDVELVGD